MRIYYIRFKWSEVSADTMNYPRFQSVPIAAIKHSVKPGF